MAVAGWNHFRGLHGVGAVPVTRAGKGGGSVELSKGADWAPVGASCLQSPRSGQPGRHKPSRVSKVCNLSNHEKYRIKGLLATASPQILSQVLGLSQPVFQDTPQTSFPVAPDLTLELATQAFERAVPRGTRIFSKVFVSVDKW